MYSIKWPFERYSSDKIIFSVCLMGVIALLSGCNRRTDFEIKQKGDAKKETYVYPDSIHHNLLQYLAPVLSAKENADTASILLTTTDLARYDDKKEAKPYVQSIQVVDANAPWPPRWYSSTALYTDAIHKHVTETGHFMYNFIIDAKIESGYLAFYKIIAKQQIKVSPLRTPDISGYILLNKDYEAVDTVTAGGKKRRSLFYHDFRLNEKKERIVDLRKDTYLDLRDFTDNDKDSVVHCYVDYIMIVDSNNKTLFSWNPMDHLDPSLFQLGKTLDSKPMATLKTDILECTRLTSAVFDYDGNILYSMREIGIGKICRKDGSIMWQINYTQIPMIDGKDTLEWYSPHDINLVSHNEKSAIYSVFSNGKKGEKNATGILFEMDKKTSKPKLLKVIKPHETFFTRGHGNLDYDMKTKDYMISYGNLKDADDGPLFRIDMEYGKNDSIYGLYKIPKYNSIYKAHKLNNWPRPPRPVISRTGDKLEVDGNSDECSWYQLSGENNTVVKFVGKGKYIKPEAGAIYCVERKYGIGFVVSTAYKNQ